MVGFLMGLKLYGIVAAQTPDNVDETIIIDGLEDQLKTLKDEHDEDSFFRKVGGITFSKKIYSEKDCENPKQLRCWNHVKVPFLYAEGELADDTDHPNAKSTAALLRFSQRPDIRMNIGFSVDGGIIDRRDADGNITEDKETGKILARTLATAAAITVKPCNPKCAIFLENDLTKSDLTAPPPSVYYKALKKHEKMSSVVATNEKALIEFKLLGHAERLKKSLSDYFGAFTSLKCHKCGNAMRFFKAGDLPNSCSKCDNQVSLSQLWKALNQ
jgi:hypothetical protein